MRRTSAASGLTLILLWASLASAQFVEPPLLDDCSPQETPLSNGGTWSAPIDTGDTGMMANASLQCRTQASGPTHSSWWNVQTFGPDMAVSADLPDAVANTTGRYVALFVRIQSPNTGGVDGYSCRYAVFDSGASLWILQDGTFTALEACPTVTYQNDDKLACRIVGSTLSSWLFSAGAWTELCSVTDATVSGTGFVGIGGTDGSVGLDNIRGGTVEAGTGVEALMPVLQ